MSGCSFRPLKPLCLPQISSGKVPADVNGQLLSFRAGQEHGVVEGMEETRLADPAPLIHQLGVHNGNLACGTSEADG